MLMYSIISLAARQAFGLDKKFIRSRACQTTEKPWTSFFFFFSHMCDLPARVRGFGLLLPAAFVPLCIDFPAGGASLLLT